MSEGEASHTSGDTTEIKGGVPVKQPLRTAEKFYEIMNSLKNPSGITIQSDDETGRHDVVYVIPDGLIAPKIIPFSRYADQDLLHIVND